MNSLLSDEEQVGKESLSPYRTHLELLHSYLSGQHSEQSIESEYNWSTDEKDRFFAALRSYSSLRPDLIAECVGSKNIAEVCMYLTALEEASEKFDSELTRPSLDIAMEVSDDWLEAEEEQAAFIRDMELAWRDNAELPAQEQEQEGLEKVEVDLTRRRNALKDLSMAHLKVIDSILQKDEGPAETLPETDSVQPSDLDPAERRRLQKRLYMRRKRAATSGVVAATDSGKLRRGRKKKETSTLQPVTSQEAGAESESDVDDQEQEQESESDEESVERVTGRKRKRKRGLTREMKVRNAFAESGIDLTVLHEENLTLFHLTSLGRLLTLYHEAHSPEGTKITGISADAIRLLSLILTDFVTHVVHRSILLREQEAHLKRQSKVWRLEGDDISPDTIERVVSMLGHPTSKVQAFDHLRREDETNEEADEHKNAVGHDLPLSSHSDDSILSPQPSHLGLSSVLIRLPRSSQCNTKLQETLMSIEIDEELLKSELAEEEALDQQDQALEKAYQEELWALYKYDKTLLQQS